MKNTLTLLACLGLVAGLHAGQESASETAAATQAQPAEVLLAQAYDIASAMPFRPHIKNRSRAQETVVVTCLELDKPELALRYAEGIDNWRRGAAYADLANYYAESKQLELAEKFTLRARKFAESGELGTEGWRQERILAKVAKAQFELGQTKAAQELAGSLEPAQQPTLVEPVVDQARVVAFLDTLPELSKTASLETMVQALNGCVPLFEQHYANKELRERIHTDVRKVWNRIPGLERMRLARSLAEVCLDQNDLPGAQSMLDDIRVLMDGMRWEARYQVPAQAYLATLRAKAGQKEVAAAEFDGALELYQTRREEIVNIYRAETITPVAQGLFELGQSEAAAKVYAQAIEEAVINPNSRPRAIDMTEILCSMAKVGFVPSPDLQKRIDEIQKGLGDPW